MNQCFFVTDLHGQLERYQKLFKLIEKEKPSAVFFGGDLFPSGLFALTSQNHVVNDFLNDILVNEFLRLKKELGKDYPRVFLILGNDDGRFEEDEILKAEEKGIWEYIHDKKVQFEGFSVYGYSYIPPSPFQLKDWEKYDVSRYVDPGCVPPEEGSHSKEIKKDDLIYGTIQKDLEILIGNDDVSKAIILFHTPPYKTKLDRAALDGKMFDHVPLDVHIGSIAVQRMIEEKQPFLTLHGHVHESASITGAWKDKIGNTNMFSAAHNSSELALIRFDPDNIEDAGRELV